MSTSTTRTPKAYDLEKFKAKSYPKMSRRGNKFRKSTVWTEPSDALLLLLEAYECIYELIEEDSVRLSHGDVQDLNLIHRIRLLNTRRQLLEVFLKRLPHTSDLIHVSEEFHPFDEGVGDYINMNVDCLFDNETRKSI